MSNTVETGTENLISINTGIQGAGSEDVLMITSQALDAIAGIRTANEVPENFYLRIATRGGGCSGMQYTMGFDSEVDENDSILDADGRENLVVDSKSLFYLMGITLDYVDGPHGSGFVFKGYRDNTTCGCGG